jgi:hypothetical protein
LRQQAIDQMAANETRATRNQKLLSRYMHDWMYNISTSPKKRLS